MGSASKVSRTEIKDREDLVNLDLEGYNPESIDRVMLQNLLMQTFESHELVDTIVDFVIEKPEISIIVKQEFQVDALSNPQEEEVDAELGDIIFAWNSIIDLSPLNAKKYLGINLLRNHLKQFIASCPNHEEFAKAYYENPEIKSNFLIHERLAGMPVTLNINCMKTLLSELEPEEESKPTHLAIFGFRHKKESEIIYSMAEMEQFIKLADYLIEQKIPAKPSEDSPEDRCAAIDPCNYQVIKQAISNQNLDLQCVLTTHHHWDHAHGNENLVKEFRRIGKEIPVYGGSDKVQAITNVVKHGDKIKLGDNVTINCLSTPCHTMDHICYHAYLNSDTSKSDGSVFTGDTLFLAGCGRFFEGTGEQMNIALNEVLGKLAPNTKVYCGHEYTENNLKFAITVDSCDEVKRRLEFVKKMRAQGEPTIPGSIEEELKTNPFMKVNDPNIQNNINTIGDPIKTINTLRQLKNEF